MRTVSTAAVLGLSAVAAAQVVTISDQTFLASAWDLVDRGGTNVTGMVEAREIGAGVTGDARRVTVNGNGSITYRAENYKNDRLWDPATDGAIASIAWEFWYRYNADPREFAATQIVARQGQTDYAAASSYREPEDDLPTWQRHHGSFPVEDFVRLRGPGPEELDVSPCAPPILFGYTNYTPVFIPTPARHRVSLFVLDITTTERCAADFDGDGMLSLADFVRFRDAYISGEGCADFDRDGALTLADFVAFRSAYAAGCP